MAGTAQPTARSVSTRLDRHARTWRDQADQGLDWLGRNLDAHRLGGPDEPICLTLANLLLVHTQLAEALSTPTAERPMPIADFVTIARTGREVELRREVAEHGSLSTLLADLRVAVQEIAERVMEPSTPAVVRGWRSAISLADLLRVTTANWVIALQALGATADPGGSGPLTRSAVADSARLLAQVLAERNPGRSVEVRVPPFAAVQIGSGIDPGSTHTRGTPPNVVETDADSFLRLATGSAGFGDLRSSGRLHASGAHADISAMFPIF